MEEAILTNWQSEMEEGKTPSPVVQQLESDTVMYYAPIQIKPLCLTCHGIQNTDIHADHLTLINEHYPADEAVDYSLGELRGMWSIGFRSK